jgi:hypothetical protein
MLKLTAVVCTVMALFSMRSQNEKFSHYKSIETYEVRPGILMMPKYAADGQVCEITLERNHYSDDTAKLDSTIPRNVITEIADELAPVSERGPVTTNFGKEYMSAYAGNGITTFADYQNVSIRIFGIASPITSAGDVVAVIEWKKRTCKIAEK